MGCGGSKDDQPGSLTSPTFLALLPGDELCISCQSALHVITTGGEPVRLLGKGRVDAPRGVVQVGSDVFVCEMQGCRVQRLNAASGATVASYGTKGSGDGQLDFPMGLALSADGGTLYVADWGNRRVVALDAKSLQFKFAFTHKSSEGAIEPCGVACGSGEVFVADQNAHQVQVFSATDGTHVRSLGENGTKPGQFKSPSGIVVLRGVLFVAEYVGQRVQALQLDGTPIQVLQVPDATSLYDLAVTAPSGSGSCTLYVTDFATSELHVLALELAQLKGARTG